MAALETFTDLDIKEPFFIKDKHYRINTKAQFDEWYQYYTSEIKEEKKTNFIYRGMGDAKYKLYTSAQRMWIENDMSEWVNVDYLDFINDMVQSSKEHPLLKKVFDTFDYSDSEREIPLLSILQHYSGPTPFMDWSYNINVALFFATEKLTGNNGISKISDYFSIYRIDKSKYIDEMLSISDIPEYYGKSISFYKSLVDEKSPTANYIFYISDFDEGNAFGANADSKITVKNNKKLFTSIYNQNIIPQEGLFIFNPFSTKTIDDIFQIGLENEGSNLVLSPFYCFNIKKDLAEYIRRRIKEKYKIDKSFIYPLLNNDCELIKNDVLNSFVR